MSKRGSRFIYLPLCVAILPMSSWADGSLAGQGTQHQIRASNNINAIGNNTLNGINGRLAVNIAAGDVNQQSNVAAISLNGLTGIRAKLSSGADGALMGHHAVSINAGSLSNGHGLLSVNQVSGISNQQVNAISLSLNPNVTASNMVQDDVSDITLSNTVAVREGHSNSRQFTTDLTLDNSALGNSAGIIQVNQVVGHDNQGINLVSLPLTYGSAASK